MARTLTVATIQFDSVDYDFESNLQRATILLRRAADRRAEIALLPEFALIGYDLSPKLWQAAETRSGRTVAAVTSLSRELGLYIGTSFLEVDGEDFYNTFILAAPDGSVAGRVRKQVPAGAEGHFFRGFVNGHVIDTALGRIGVGVYQGAYLSELTLGSWLERRLTWASIKLADWLGTDPDDAIARQYSQSAKRVAAAREHPHVPEDPAGAR